MFAEETAGTLGVAVAAKNGVTLPVEKLCEKRAGRTCSQDKNPHGVKQTLTYPDNCLPLKNQACCLLVYCRGRRLNQ
jgi:hypothetical protein